MSERTDTLEDLQLVAESIRAAHLDAAVRLGVTLEQAKNLPGIGKVFDTVNVFMQDGDGRYHR